MISRLPPAYNRMQQHRIPKAGHGNGVGQDQHGVGSQDAFREQIPDPVLSLLLDPRVDGSSRRLWGALEIDFFEAGVVGTLRDLLEVGNERIALLRPESVRGVQLARPLLPRAVDLAD